MYRYTLYGLLLESDIDFPQLVVSNDMDADADVVICERTVPNMVIHLGVMNRYGFASQRSWVTNDTMYLWTERGKRIFYMPKKDANMSYLRTYILGYGMSMIALQNNKLAIHCAAVAGADGALLIAGESGSGKSTLTSALLKDGYSFMADDMAVVERDEDGQPVVAPGFPFQKLCRDAVEKENYDIDKLIYIGEEKDKFLVPYQGTFQSEKMPVKAMLILTKDDVTEPMIEEVKGIQKVQAIYGNLFLRRMLRNCEVDQEYFQVCLKTAGKLPIYVVVRPKEGDSVGEIMDLIKETLG